MPLFTSRKQQQHLKVTFQNDMLLVEQAGGKQQVFPLAFFPKLKDASEEERNDWTATSGGIHWNKLDFNLSIS
ncbi:DUF2442 domain-containing protein [Mucilaginibacter sp. RS28]|uniref:DUF2442 domain-containing protein n=1 Tax=Mucilaginibacter straminoryzae TaxID=2932774 RepID=A0A9X1X6V3_9SPHI|nr:DUF2442 domain-containing protein [Mucilaginibacter straminoryzae]MCJ8212021.1 DUF2442 domain-containing protein [Mucilaginibacter straminoryzae]